jgi:hypothetical protein
VRESAIGRRGFATGVAGVASLLCALLSPGGSGAQVGQSCDVLTLPNGKYAGCFRWYAYGISVPWCPNGVGFTFDSLETASRRCNGQPFPNGQTPGGAPTCDELRAVGLNCQAQCDPGAGEAVIERVLRTATPPRAPRIRAMRRRPRRRPPSRPPRRRTSAAIRST